MTDYNYERELENLVWNFPRSDRYDAQGVRMQAASEIMSALPGIDFKLRCGGSQVVVAVDGDLTSEQQATLVNIIAACKAATGSPAPRFEWKASSTLRGDAKAVEGSDWEEIGGAVTHLTAFVPDVTKAWGRCTGQFKTNGSGAQIRIIRESDGTSCMTAPYDLPDTENAWEIHSFWVSTNQPQNPDRFVLQGKKNSSSVLEGRDVAISLLEKLN